MMAAELIAVLDGSPADRAVRSAGSAVAHLLGVDLRLLRIDGAADTAEAADAVLAALAEPTARGCVLVAEAEPAALCWQVVVRTEQPVVLVPPAATMPRREIKRALLPLDGTPEAAQAVRRTAHLLDRAGIELVVLHVFHQTSVPRFWDQRAHAHDAWKAEFLSRSGTPVHAGLELRTGLPGEHVLRAAHSQDVDLIAMAWSRTMQPGRAQVVRRAVAEASVPVVLLPIAAD